MSGEAGSRDKILSSIRQSLKAARHIPAQPQVSLPPPPAASGDLAAQFTAQLTELTGQVLTLKAADIPAWLSGMLCERKVEAVMAWSEAELPVPGLLTALRADGIRIVEPMLPPDEPGRSAALAEVEKLTVGVTGADAGFADTGTLALNSGPGRPRLASLSVRTHIALLERRRLYPSWAAWLVSEGQGATQRLTSASNLTLITGPSRTADIEMTLTVGVHGPGELIVAIVQ